MFGRNRIPQKDEETTWTRITAMPEQPLSGILIRRQQVQEGAAAVGAEFNRWWLPG